MDLGFLSGLFGGENNAMLSALLPLLLGGKTSGGLDPTALGGILSGLLKTQQKEDAFPPLFGSEEGNPAADPNGLFNILGSMLSAPQGKKSESSQAGKYPYELQYNRPQ